MEAMTVFTCRKQGCEREPRAGLDGLCIPCHLRERSEGGPARPQITAPAPTPEPEDQKENEMGMKTAICDECKRELKDGERVYKGKCKDCRSKGIRPRAPRKAKTAEKPKAADTARKAPPTVVDQLLGEYTHHGDKARAIRQALTTIKELTGADFEIPEIGI